MRIIHYPHPALRFKSQPIRRVDEELRGLVRQMFELMYEAKGVGLAANQVDLPLRLFVVNVAGNPDEGEEMVFVNPVLALPKGVAEQEEGCLSLPSVYGQVKRPKQIRVNAYTLSGSEISGEIDGMLARVVQHEYDHLDGVLFTDRMSETGRVDVQEALDEFETEYSSRRAMNQIPSDEELTEQREVWLKKYT